MLKFNRYNSNCECIYFVCCCILKTNSPGLTVQIKTVLNLTSNMSSSIEIELEKSFGSKHVDNPKRTLSTGGKILIGLSGKNESIYFINIVPFTNSMQFDS